LAAKKTASGVHQSYNGLLLLSMERLMSLQTKLSFFVAILAGLAIPISTAGQNISMGAMLLCGLLTIVSGRKLLDYIKMPFSIAALALGFAFVLSIAWTSASSTEAWAFILKLRNYFFIPVFLFFFSNEKHRKGFLISFSSMVMLSVILSCLSAWIDYPIYKAKIGDWAVFRDHITHNLFASLLGAGLFCGLVMKQWTDHKKYFAMIGLGLISYNIFFVVPGRTGQLVFLGMLATILLVWNWRKGLLLGSIGILIMGSVLLNYSSVVKHGFEQAHDETLAYIQGSTDHTSMGLRLEFYKNSLQLIQEQPFFGHGVASYSQEYKRLTTTNHSFVPESSNPHNNYLWFGVELGAMGILTLLGLVVGAAWQARSLRPLWRANFFALLACMEISSLANSFFVDYVSGSAFILLACALLNSPSLLKNNQGLANP
jgi:O-antigen ligase